MVSESRHFLPLATMPSRIFKSYSVGNLKELLTRSPSTPVLESHSAEEVTALPPSATIKYEDLNESAPTVIVASKNKQSRFRRFAHKAKKMIVKKKKVEPVVPVEEVPVKQLSISSPTDFVHVKTGGFKGLRDADGEFPGEHVNIIPRKPVPSLVCTPSPDIAEAQSDDGSTITDSK
ncbi:hypothetical protein DM02DRAFT_692641 [Periconia macrospinosa]|uniref:Uncharacterized protein n=1 Tax=Periconia macrospinosa TaxID=97972 RepID=A0A2V1D994_9PLEO|nr:hypothetical protein DM02DRAFT_692641 [Periconia macrospinosa]